MGGAMKVLAVECETWEQRAFAARLPEHETICAAGPLDALAPDAHADAQVLCPFVHSRLDAQALARFPDLRLVATRSTGFDHIDLGACAARGILVCNVPDYGDRTVAEHTFALLLAVSRRLVEAVDATRRGEFAGERLRGFDLAGRTIGVIGAGRIGRRVLAIARGFGMEAIACDPAPDAAVARALGFAYASLDDLLARADVVSLHAPGGAATRGMIGRAQIARMKQGAVLVNTARGDLVDVSALADALHAGHLRGAGLDVLPDEPLLRDEAEIFRAEAGAGARADLRGLLASHALLRMRNVVVTPHVAYNTTDAMTRIVEATAENVRAFARGAPRNLVSA
jgi:D-lactate dehydrogenase